MRRARPVCLVELELVRAGRWIALGEGSAASLLYHIACIALTALRISKPVGLGTQWRMGIRRPILDLELFGSLLRVRGSRAQLHLAVS